MMGANTTAYARAARIPMSFFCIAHDAAGEEVAIRICFGDGFRRGEGGLEAGMEDGEEEGGVEFEDTVGRRGKWC